MRHKSTCPKHILPLPLDLRVGKRGVHSMVYDMGPMMTWVSDEEIPEYDDGESPP